MNPSRIFNVCKKYNKVHINTNEDQTQPVSILYPGKKNTTMQILSPFSYKQPFQEASEFLNLLDETIQRIKQSLSYLSEPDKQFYYKKVLLIYHQVKTQCRNIAKKTLLNLEFLENQLMPRGENVEQLAEKFQNFFTKLVPEINILENYFNELKANCEQMKERILNSDYYKKSPFKDFKVIVPALALVACFTFSWFTGTAISHPVLIGVTIVSSTLIAYYFAKDPFAPLNEELKIMVEKTTELENKCGDLKAIPTDGFETGGREMLRFYMDKAKKACEELLVASNR